MAEAKGLNKRVEVIKGPYAGQQGTVRQVKHGAFKGAPKSFFVDLDDGTQFDNVPGSALRLIKDLDEEKVRLDPKCWTGKKIGNPKTKMKGGVRVNNCVPK